MQGLLEIAMENPENFLALHDLQGIQDAAASIGLPPLGFGKLACIKTLASINEPVGMDFVCTHWSVIGLLVHRKGFADLHQCFQALNEHVPPHWPKLRDPHAMPITENFVEQRGLTQPLGQWIPAFKDQDGRTHDLMDLCVNRISSDHFGVLAQYFSQFSNDAPEVKAGYLARQAARAYDVYMHDFELDGSLTSEVGKVVGCALMEGASISQAAWSGPDPLQNQRPFSTTQSPLRELSYTLTTSVLDDKKSAATLKRLHEEGHDIVVYHKDDAERHRNERPVELPLHICVEAGHVHRVRELLNAGADTSAKVFHDYDASSDKGLSVYDIVERKGERLAEIGAMIYAFEARQAARDAIEGMGLDGFRVMGPR